MQGHNRGAVCRITRGILRIKSNAVTQQLLQGILKAFCGGVQRHVLLLLDDTDRIGLAVSGSIIGVVVTHGIILRTAAGSQAQGHDAGEKQSKELLFHHDRFLHTFKLAGS